VLLLSPDGRSLFPGFPWIPFPSMSEDSFFFFLHPKFSRSPPPASPVPLILIRDKISPLRPTQFIDDPNTLL